MANSDLEEEQTERSAQIPLTCISAYLYIDFDLSPFLTAITRIKTKKKNKVNLMSIPVFAIVPLNPGPDDKYIRKKLEQLQCGYFLAEAPSVYMVSYKGTCYELTKALGFDNKTETPGKLLVLQVTDYSGYAHKELWEWIILHQSTGQTI